MSEKLCIKCGAPAAFPDAAKNPFTCIQCQEAATPPSIIKRIAEKLALEEYPVHLHEPVESLQKQNREYAKTRFITAITEATAPLREELDELELLNKQLESDLSSWRNSVMRMVIERDQLKLRAERSDNFREECAAKNRIISEERDSARAACAVTGEMLKDLIARIDNCVLSASLEANAYTGNLISSCAEYRQALSAPNPGAELVKENELLREMVLAINTERLYSAHQAAANSISTTEARIKAEKLLDEELRAAIDGANK